MESGRAQVPMAVLNLASSRYGWARIIPHGVLADGFPRSRSKIIEATALAGRVGRVTGIRCAVALLPPPSSWQALPPVDLCMLTCPAGLTRPSSRHRLGAAANQLSAPPPIARKPAMMRVYPGGRVAR